MQPDIRECSSDQGSLETSVMENVFSWNVMWCCFCVRLGLCKAGLSLHDFLWKILKHYLGAEEIPDTK